ncbi:MAG: hypothetical protein P8182_06510, partial [Deltaproteobacteria bacterium]
SQLGSKGFFGPFNIDNGAPNPGAAGVVNFWQGERLGFDANLVSGADAYGQLSYLTLFPQLRFNKAVRIRGRYRVGTWVFNVPNAGEGVGYLARSEYLNSQEGGVQRSFSPGYWELLWLSAQTPWGIITLGKRPAKLGCGLIFDGTDNYTVETTSMVVQTGPLRLGFAFYPSRVGGTAYWNRADRSGNRQLQAGMYVTYRVGCMDMGGQNIHVRIHQGPEGRLDPAAREALIPYDRVDNFGTSYVKYNNGRFFFNTELAWYNRIEHRLRSVTVPASVPGAGSPFRPVYRNHWRYMVELGTFAGPAKLSLLWATITGPDRRHGVLIDRGGEHRAATTGNTSVFLPYSHILVYNYGGANNSFTNARNGYLTDAVAYGARLDYAVAANLNVFSSFFWADRPSHGYGWGYIAPAIDGAGIPTGSVRYSRKGGFTDPAPAIPDSNLGYEIDWGFDWQLLESYRLSGTFGYWQPGRWFNFACADRANPGWKTPGAANNWGINPDRSIDPVYGMKLVISGEF